MRSTSQPNHETKLPLFINNQCLWNLKEANSSKSTSLNMNSTKINKLMESGFISKKRKEID